MYTNKENSYNSTTTEKQITPYIGKGLEQTFFFLKTISERTKSM